MIRLLLFVVWVLVLVLLGAPAWAVVGLALPTLILFSVYGLLEHAPEGVGRMAEEQLRQGEMLDHAKETEAMLREQVATMRSAFDAFTKKERG